MAHLCRMGWTQYLELSGLKRSIDWVSRCSSRGRGQQLLLPAVLLTSHAAHLQPLITTALIVSCAWEPIAQPTLKESSTDRPDNQVTTKSIVYRRHSPMEIGKACRVGQVGKPGRGTMRVAQPVGPTKCPINRNSAIQNMYPTE